uniref:Uncharacterized protein n=1 Tax=Romanomermis culicivorax TaxID=13658 RepID=A0A915K4E9_ROMCU
MDGMPATGQSSLQRSDSFISNTFESTHHYQINQSNNFIVTGKIGKLTESSTNAFLSVLKWKKERIIYHVFLSQKLPKKEGRLDTLYT